MLGQTVRRFAASLTISPRPRSIITINSVNTTISKYLGPTTNKFRDEMVKKNYYAVVKGRRPGIYRSWPDCQAQVNNFKGCVFKGFISEREALEYMARHGSAGVSSALPASHIDADNEDIVIPRPPKSRSAAPTPFLVVPQAIIPSNAPSTSTVRIEFDGASKSNPGPAAFGAALYDTSTGELVGRVSRFMGEYHTNNQAEYAGLIAGMQTALEMGYESVEVVGDSKLIVNQVLGSWAVKNEGLQPYHAAATALKKRFKKFKARQVPRAQNKVADALGNEAIDAWRNGAAGEFWKLPGIVVEGGEVREKKERRGRSEDEDDASLLDDLRPSKRLK